MGEKETKNKGGIHKGRPGHDGWPKSRHSKDAALEQKRAHGSKALVLQEAGAKNSTLAFCATTIDVYKKMASEAALGISSGTFITHVPVLI